MNPLTLTRQVEVRIIHRLENAELSVAENQKLYGICYGRHGHNFKVQVTVADSKLNEKSGLIFDRAVLDRILQTEIVEKFDGRDLNAIVENPCCEVICQEFYDRLAPHFQPGQLVRVAIRETRKNYFEFPPAGTVVVGEGTT